MVIVETTRFGGMLDVGKCARFQFIPASHYARSGFRVY